MALKKLYPPNIEGTLPAFTGNKLVIPYSMNRAVSFSEVKGFNVKIKSINSNSLLYSFSTDNQLDDCTGTFTQDTVTFYFPEEGNKFNIGQYYKIQIAYFTADDNTKVIGYYSTVGVTKYTAEPEIAIEGLEAHKINTHIYEYMGKYSMQHDTLEKVYSYRFDLTDTNHKIIKTSGELIHNSTNDDLYESYDYFDINQDLEENKAYYLKYTVTTLNGLVRSSPNYRIMQKRSIDPDLKADLIASLNFDNGYVNLSLVGKTDDSGNEYAATGDYKILRASEEDGYTTWTEILKFALYGEKPSRWLWKDFTIRQGVNYKYGIQQYNGKVSSNRIESETIYVDFEDAFLYDGERQLKIKYNPKVSSFKDTLLETATNTIGNKYPFIFRNGNVKYKQFPISGLISYQMDEEKLFMSNNSYTMEVATHNLTGENIAAERDFKLNVLDWLNDGKPKIFRSPTEGNYIVRLLNVSLSPTDTVGRMLHTFSATAYEVEEFNYSTLGDLGFLQTSDPTIEQIRWETIDLTNPDVNKNLLNYEAVSLSLIDMIPGDQINITYKSGDTQTIHIGATGSYIIDLAADVVITEVYFPEQRQGMIHHQGSLTYGFLSKIQNKFDFVDDIDISEIPMTQLIGEHSVFKELEDVRSDVQNIYFIHAIKRNLYTTTIQALGDIVAYAGGFDDAFAIYYNKDGFENGSLYYDAFNNKYYDEYKPNLIVDGESISLNEIGEKVWYNSKIEEIKTQNGVMLEIGYQVRYITYNFDVYDSTVKELRIKYEQESIYLYALIYGVDRTLDYYQYNTNCPTRKELDTFVNDISNTIEGQTEIVNQAYKEYITLLDKTIEEELLDQGDEPISR